MDVFVRLKDNANRLLAIEIRVPFQDKLLFVFPTWRPGRYEQANYSATISAIKITQKGSIIAPVYRSVNKFEVIPLQHKKDIVLQYTVFCNEINAGSSYIDEDQWYFNFINFIPAIKGQENEAVQLYIDYPADFKVYSALAKKDNAFFASTYYNLVDAPFLASRYLEIQSFLLEGVPFQLAINNTEQLELPWQKLMNDFTKFALPQKELFSAFPFKAFTYLIQLLPFKAYHGVEHKNCTVITIGPSEKAIHGDWYKELLGVSSHELFHCWNVTRLRPKEMLPYDFSKQQIHKTGFVTEGFTTYYGDLMLIRGSVFGLSEYLEEVNTYLKRYLENPAYKTVSIVESSISLWANGYKAGPPFNHVSIYIKGALLALLLDLKLRKQGASLDELMRLLWNNYLEEGYTYEDVIDAINTLQDRLGDFFSTEYYQGTRDIISELEKELQELGIVWVYENNPEQISHELGVLLSLDKRVTYVDPESSMHDVLCIGDEIIEYSSSALKVKRMEKEVQISIVPTEKSFFSLPKLNLADDITVVQKERLKDWLGLS